MATLITVPLHKNCILALTPAEYSRALARGKALKRRQRFERRAAEMQRDREQRREQRIDCLKS